MDVVGEGDKRSGPWSIRTWGTTELSGPAGAVTLRPRERAVLAALAIDHPAAVSNDQMIERLWGDTPPPSASKALRNHVSRIRSAVDRVVATDPGGYRLDQDVVITPPTPAELGAAEPFSELEDVQTVAVSRLTEQRRRLDERFDQLRQAARSAHLPTVLDDIADFALAHPGHHGAVELHVQALAAAGRRLEALAVIGGARDHASDLGMEFERSLRDLERRLLDDDPTLKTSVRASTEQPPEAGHLIEFTRHLDVLEAPTEPAAVRLVLVSGPAGIGKTTLVEHVRDRSHSRGRTSMLVSCSPEPSVPLEPIADLLHQVARRFPDRIAAISNPGALRALAPTIPLPAAISAGVGGPQPDRAAIFAAVAELLSTGATPIVVIVEDLHWATRLTMQILEACVADVSGGPGVTVIGTCRTVPGELARLAADHIELDPWDRSTVTEYVGRYGRSARWVAEASDWVYRQSGGNALHVRELTMAAHAGGARSGDGDAFEAPSDVPPSLLAALRATLDALTPATRRDLGAAAVLGRRFRRDEWAAMGVDVARSSAEAEAADVVVAVGAGLTKSRDLEFRHDLLHQLVSDDLPAGQRTEWHDLAADVISRSTGDEIERRERADELARHSVGAVGLDPRRAVTSLFRWIDLQMQRFADDSAIDACRVGLALTAPDGPAAEPSASVAFEARLGKLLLRVGDPGALDQLLSAAEHALATGDDMLMAEAIRETCRLGPTSVVGAVDETARDLLDRADRAVTDPRARAIIATAGVMLYAISGEYDRCRSYFETAASYHGHVDTRVDALSLAVLVLTEHGDIERRIEIERELTELAAGLGTPDARWGAAHLRMTNQVQLGDPRQRETLRELGELANRSRHRARLWEYRNWSASVALTSGDPEMAELRAGEALECIDAVAESLVMAAYGAQLLSIRHAQDRVGEMLDTVREIVDAGDGIGAWHAVLALAAADAGEPGLARRELDWMCADDFGGLDHDYTFNGALFVGALAACEIGAGDLAEVFESALAPWSGRWAFVGTCVMGPIDGALARLAAQRGDVPRAIELAQRARTAAEHADAPIYADQSAVLLAELGVADAGARSR